MQRKADFKANIQFLDAVVETMKTHRDPIKAAKQQLKKQLTEIKSKQENDAAAKGAKGGAVGGGVNFDFNSSESENEDEAEAKLNQFYDQNGNQIEGVTLEQQITSQIPNYFRRLSWLKLDTSMIRFQNLMPDKV